MTARSHPLGEYRYVPGIEPYSGGVLASAGFEIRHIELRVGRPWRDGLDLARELLAERGLEPTALCAVELRCPRPHTFEGFIEFNTEYRALLRSWGLLVGEDNPVARTNVAPVQDPPSGTELVGFSIVTPSTDADAGPPSFVIAGAGDLVDQADLRPEAIVAADGGDSAAWAARIGQVMSEMETRMGALGVGWADVTDIDVYCASSQWADLAREAVLQRAGRASAVGMRWFVAHPPITGLSFEMDVRGVNHEERL
jgi:hypothetical protein